MDYSIDDGRIRAPDAAFAPEAWNDAPTFEEALSEAAKVCIPCVTLGSRREPWVSELREKQSLDIEEGASLVTGLNCRLGRMPFKWRGEKFYPIRPDLGFLIIVTHFQERPLNRVERELHERFFEHRAAVASLHHAIMRGKIDPADACPFDWWVEFWGKRGFAMPSEREAPMPRAKPGPKSRADEMTEALRALLADGAEFRTKKAAYQAVTGRLGVRGSERGLSYSTFLRRAGPLLSGD